MKTDHCYRRCRRCRRCRGERAGFLLWDKWVEDGVEVWRVITGGGNFGGSIKFRTQTQPPAARQCFRLKRSNPAYLDSIPVFEYIKRITKTEPVQNGKIMLRTTTPWKAITLRKHIVYCTIQVRVDISELFVERA